MGTTRARPWCELILTDLTVDILAAWRLTRLFGVDTITEPMRDKTAEFVSLYGVGQKVLQLLDCPYCLSIWAAGTVLVLKRLPLGKTVVRLLALSAVAGEVSSRLDSW